MYALYTHQRTFNEEITTFLLEALLIRDRRLISSVPYHAATK